MKAKGWVHETTDVLEFIKVHIRNVFVVFVPVRF